MFIINILLQNCHQKMYQWLICEVPGPLLSVYIYFIIVTKLLTMRGHFAYDLYLLSVEMEVYVCVVCRGRAYQS